MLAHQNHVSTVQQLIKEITYPLTVGSFTTIGAFFGLTFTTSELLRDFGLFASLASALPFSASSTFRIF